MVAQLRSEKETVSVCHTVTPRMNDSHALDWSLEWSGKEAADGQRRPTTARDCDGGAVRLVLRRQRQATRASLCVRDL